MIKKVKSQKSKVKIESAVRSILFTFIFFLGLLSQSFAQEFTASVNETTVADNERFQVTFTFSGKSINNLAKFSPPSFENFLILSGPNQSTSIQIINGAQSASLSYSFVVQPKSVGNFTIGSASIEQEGTTYKSNPIKISVVKGQDKPKQKQQNDSEISESEISKNLYIRASVDKTRAFKGEQITIVYKLYTRLNIASQMGVNKLPQYQNFWAEELETSGNINFTTEVVDGKQFRVGVLKRVALFQPKQDLLK
ncbi:MAG: BatD family protein [bacterium]|nr:BatD family protein [bacterium]